MQKIEQENQQKLINDIKNRIKESINKFSDDEMIIYAMYETIKDDFIDSCSDEESKDINKSFVEESFNEVFDCAYDEMAYDLIERTSEKKDPGAHYRKFFMGYRIDVGRVCKIFEVDSMMLQIAVKKSLVCGKRGYKDKKTDIEDAINALERELEMMIEDEEFNNVK